MMIAFKESLVQTADRWLLQQPLSGSTSLWLFFFVALLQYYNTAFFYVYSLLVQCLSEVRLRACFIHLEIIVAEPK